MNIQLVVIDPQNDFCTPQGSLYVQGADQDMSRLALMVKRLGRKLDDIHITMDSHRLVDISHPIWFKDNAGKHPDPFTVITDDDMEAGRWTTTQPSAYTRTLKYLRALKTGGRYPHVIWPPHCLIGDVGHNVHKDVAEAVHEWEQTRYALADFVTKGSNPWTEHFSAVQAEVPDPTDPSTQVNTRFIQTLESADMILLAGEALSHCTRHTVTDVMNTFADPVYVQKMVLLRDCTSPVTGFETQGDDFVREFQARGGTVSDSVRVLS